MIPTPRTARSSIPSSTALAARLLSLYPVLAELPPALRDGALATQAGVHKLPEGKLLFEQGTPCMGLPLVLSGEVRVARGTPGGRSIGLYRVTPGEMSLASTSCLFGQAPLVAHGVTVTSTELVVLSPAAFARWTAHEPFHGYVFGSFADRLADMMTLVEAVAFQHSGPAPGRRAAGPRCHHPAHASIVGRRAGNGARDRDAAAHPLRARWWIGLGRERMDILDASALRAQAGGPAAR